MTIAATLAEHIAAVRYDDLPPDAVHWAKVAILDTIGCTLAGSAEQCARIVDHVTTAGASHGPCLIFGTSRRAAPLDAALINGTAAHALDYDDVSNTLGGHPSAPIVPALFALAETQGAGGRAFVTAFVTGFETETRIARGVNFHHYEKGWHPTATLGVFGATAACCHLLGLPPDRVAVALGLAASFASGVKANFGTMTKPLHVGHCSRNGLLAALLAADGFTANPGALEHKQGFLLVFNGAGNFDAEAITRGWGDPWDMEHPGVGIKQYPCCGSTHPAVDAMLMLVRAHGLTPAMVERVDSWTHPRRLAHTNRPMPNSDLDAKFSVQYCLARALTNRAVKLEHFFDDSYRDADVQALLPRIHAAPHPEMRLDNSGEHFGAEVRVTLTDGRVLSQRVGQAIGRGVDNPLPAELLEAKFLDCASRALSAEKAQRLLETLRRIESLENLSRDLAIAEDCPASRPLP
ncbi:MAG TPA: MmgE/PrpD family protein [Acetobacteraceae bacterium]|nr:MmgE/PrpD family protein [Acetobacteraceae bacterium]